jgi:hypothetical protein
MPAVDLLESVEVDEQSGRRHPGGRQGSELFEHSPAAQAPGQRVVGNQTGEFLAQLGSVGGVAQARDSTGDRAIPDRTRTSRPRCPLTIGYWGAPPSLWTSYEEHELSSRPVGRTADFVEGKPVREQRRLDLVTRPEAQGRVRRQYLPVGGEYPRPPESD